MTKGSHHSQQTKELLRRKVADLWNDPTYRTHMSTAHKGQITWGSVHFKPGTCTNTGRTHFRKGNTPWNADTSGLMHAWNKGILCPQWAGDKNPRWKGGRENKLMHMRRRRALKAGAEGSHTLQEWELLKYYMGNICLSCYRPESEVNLTEDHIVPLSLRGSDDILNIQPLCQSCNSRKSNSIINYREVLFS